MQSSSLVLSLALTVFAGCGEDREAGEEVSVGSRDKAKIALGGTIYTRHCASCHGSRLEGQPDWRRRKADGRMPAPPHDESGHTWHHPDGVLIGITKQGLVPPFAPRGYQSDMPAFGGMLSDDDILAVITFIKSHWTSREVLDARAEMTGSRNRK